MSKMVYQCPCCGYIVSYIGYMSLYFYLLTTCVDCGFPMKGFKLLNKKTACINKGKIINNWR